MYNSVLCEPRTVKCAFIREHKYKYPAGLMCQLLGVSSSGFYGWLETPHKTELMQQIDEIFQHKKKRYGSPRIWRELKNRGIRVGKQMVEDLMREMGLKARPRKRYRSTTDSNHNLPIAPNILERKFNIDKVDSAWLSDITYLPLIDGGFVYLCVVMDLASREIVGWYVDDNMEAKLVCQAFLNAILSRANAPRGAIFHSDRGSQYSSEQFRKLLELYGLRQSMSRRAQCWDNAPMESFFGSLKEEYNEDPMFWFTNLEDARSGLFEYIEIFYNRQRMHSGIGYLIPACYVSPIDSHVEIELT
ncbi:MAG: IS3 family transposase [Oligoflexus sp.]